MYIYVCVHMYINICLKKYIFEGKNFKLGAGPRVAPSPLRGLTELTFVVYLAASG